MSPALNGKFDDATLEAVKSAPVHEQMEFLLTCAFETRRSMRILPEVVERAIQEHENRYHSDERERKWWIADVIGTRLSALFWLLLGAMAVSVFHYITRGIW